MHRVVHFKLKTLNLLFTPRCCMIPNLIIRWYSECSPGGHLYFRLDITLIKGFSKHTLNTYFSGMKIEPKYVFLHVFFLNLCVMSFPKYVIMTKNIPLFSNFARLHPLNDVRAYIAWYEDDTQLQIQVAPGVKSTLLYPLV